MWRLLTDNDKIYFALLFDGRNSDKSVVLQQQPKTKPGWIVNEHRTRESENKSGIDIETRGER